MKTIELTDEEIMVIKILCDNRLSYNKEVYPITNGLEMENKVLDSIIEKTKEDEKPWYEQICNLLKQIYEIADFWENPFRNDAGYEDDEIPYANYMKIAYEISINDDSKVELVEISKEE